MNSNVLSNVLLFFMCMLNAKPLDNWPAMLIWLLGLFYAARAVYCYEDRQLQCGCNCSKSCGEATDD